MLRQSLKRASVRSAASLLGIAGSYHLISTRALCEPSNVARTTLADKLQEQINSNVLLRLPLMIAVSFMIGGVTSYRLYAQSSKAWRSRQFYSTINVTLNTVTRNPSADGAAEGYNIFFRTLLELEAKAVIPNEKGLELLLKAARKSNVEQPLIEMPDQNTQWTICNHLANRISSLSASAFLHRDILSQHEAVRSESYIMVLASEPATAATNAKIRVHLIKRAVLEQLIKDSDSDEREVDWSDKLKNKEFLFRWQVLRRILDIYRQQTRQNEGHIRWGSPLCEIELSTPIFVADEQNDDARDPIMPSLQSNIVSGWNLFHIGWNPRAKLQEFTAFTAQK